MWYITKKTFCLNPSSSSLYRPRPFFSDLKLYIKTIIIKANMVSASDKPSSGNEELLEKCFAENLSFSISQRWIGTVCWRCHPFLLFFSLIVSIFVGQAQVITRNWSIPLLSLLLHHYLTKWKMSDFRGCSEGYSLLWPPLSYYYHFLWSLQSQRQHTIHFRQWKTHVADVTQFWG